LYILSGFAQAVTANVGGWAVLRARYGVVGKVGIADTVTADGPRTVFSARIRCGVAIEDAVVARLASFLNAVTADGASGLGFADGVTTVPVDGVSVVALFPSVLDAVATVGHQAIQPTSVGLGIGVVDSVVALFTRFLNSVTAEGVGRFGFADGATPVPVDGVTVVALFPGILDTVPAEGDLAIEATCVGLRVGVAGAVVAGFPDLLDTVAADGVRLRFAGTGATVSAGAVAVVALFSGVLHTVSAVEDGAVEATRVRFRIGVSRAVVALLAPVLNSVPALSWVVVLVYVVGVGASVVTVREGVSTRTTGSQHQYH